ncbi:MAG: Rid family hydrolase [Bilophila wadsworthia]
MFITNMADFPLVNAEYSKVFAENPPARSCVAVKELPLGGLVEIEVLAVV